MRRETLLNLVIALALLAVPLAAQALDEPFAITLATKVAILALAGVGLNIALGLGGMVSLGHAAFFGIGGYMMAVLATPVQAYEPLMTWPIELAGTKSMPLIWLGAVVAGAVGALAIGALSLRTSGVYFIMITLAFGQMLYYFAISWPAYGGEDGIAIYVRNGFPGLNTLDPLHFFALAYAVLLAALWLAHRLGGSPFGLALAGARQAPARVAALGIRPYRLKLAAFVLSGAVTALAGALYADLNRFVSPSMLSWHTSGEIMVLVILGGVGRLFGPVAGAALFILLEHFLGGISEYWQLFLGLILLGIVLFARGGLIGTLAGREVPHD
ncbi:branched-chain amino acid ABC transporter permease [Rhodovulum adriaticum]|uniref:Amino acid/amide ABC transporter membrane protein 2 (HAAT family) n=1 Tax=Rhodovulum adriaticum TaxID=35804 RepID=A0A4R2NIX8_RHOAD|nr:branched-chain amino acid ABC transporter permease [Rhodovulum adriaticum]MBK1636623.1 branched-chain amino acid ABC transporter permease [Rhodovulum adriaticum]TCP21360.1 amino acid/amide ABC transporter membrane protein 2 (HAAT family) [Rhodovulum adriaticum]